MANFGETLKRERELREISLRQISEATKINIRYLEALEENRFDALPGGLFNKGFIRAYSTYIGIDGEAMVNSYLAESGARQLGSEPNAATRGSSAQLHRPQEVPQRRASSYTASHAASDRPSTLSLTLTPVARRAQDERAPAPASRPHGSEARSTGDDRPPARDLPNPQPALRPAVTGIEEAGSGGAGSSRVLMWVLSLVAVAGVLFLIVSLARGTFSSSQRPEEAPAQREETPAVPGGDETPAPEGRTDQDRTDQDNIPAAMPEVADESPLLLGAAGAPPPPTQAPPPLQPPSAAAASKPTPKRILPAPVSPPPAEEEPAAETRREARAARGPMKIEIESRERSYVVLVCDGAEILNRMMEAGETQKAKCDSVIRVSASDAGAVRLSMNGHPCLPLGDPGTRAYGYTIHLDDYARICPDPEGRADERP